MKRRAGRTVFIGAMVIAMVVGLLSFIAGGVFAGIIETRSIPWRLTIGSSHTRVEIVAPVGPTTGNWQSATETTGVSISWQYEPPTTAPAGCWWVRTGNPVPYCCYITSTISYNLYAANADDQNNPNYDDSWTNAWVDWNSPMQAGAGYEIFADPGENIQESRSWPRSELYCFAAERTFTDTYIYFGAVGVQLNYASYGPLGPLGSLAAAQLDFITSTRTASGYTTYSLYKPEDDDPPPPGPIETDPIFPEPSSLLSIIGGITILGLIRRRKL